MRLTVFSPDVPYPANRGGRADIWRRLLALRQLGIAVQLVSFYDDLPGKQPTPEHLSVMRAHVDDLHVYPIRKGLRLTCERLPHIVHTPWHVVSRSLDRRARAALVDVIQAFKPDSLWAEGPWCGREVLSAARALGLPLVYRSHNIEHLYMPRQAAAARRMRDRLAWRVASIGLERFERLMIDRATWVFDISADDLAFWQARGVRHASWLPPMAESALAADQLAATAAAPEPTLDVVFLGNLTTPNNVRGVEWLVQEVRPLVLAARPGTQFMIAGSNPGDHVRSVCQAPGVTLQANVPDAVALYRQARVLVNPVRTGSGTHVKVIEMLMMRAPIVTSVQGTCGLPPDVKRLFRVGDTAQAFADHIVAALCAPQDCWDERADARALFGAAGLSQALTALPLVPSATLPPQVQAHQLAGGQS